jgi:hypothetical protein
MSNILVLKAAMAIAGIRDESRRRRSRSPA